MLLCLTVILTSLPVVAFSEHDYLEDLVVAEQLQLEELSGEPTLEPTLEPMEESVLEAKIESMTDPGDVHDIEPDIQQNKQLMMMQLSAVQEENIGWDIITSLSVSQSGDGEVTVKVTTGAAADRYALYETTGGANKHVGTYTSSTIVVKEVTEGEHSYKVQPRKYNSAGVLEYGIFSDIVSVNVIFIEIEKIVLNKSSIVLESGEGYQLYPDVYPTNAMNQFLIWSSSNTAVATVSDYGYICAIAEGTAMITCKAIDGSGVSARCNVTVEEPEEEEESSISLNYKEYELDPAREKTVQLVATVVPSNLKVTWKSSNTRIATVNQNGLVTFVDEDASDDVTITATTSDGMSASCVFSMVTIIIPDYGDADVITLSSPVIKNASTGATYSAKTISDYDIGDGPLQLSWSASGGSGKYHITAILMNKAPDFTDAGWNELNSSANIKTLYNDDVTWTQAPFALADLKEGTYLKVAIGVYAVGNTSGKPDAWTTTGIRIVDGTIDPTPNPNPIDPDTLTTYGVNATVMCEGTYSSVNPKDGTSFSIGKLQWNATYMRAVNLLRKIIAVNHDNAYAMLGAKLYSEINTAADSHWKTRQLTSSEASTIGAFISTSTGKRIQDEQAIIDINSYLKNARSYGITDPGALIFYCQVENVGGAGRAKTVANAAYNKAGSWAAVDLDALYNAACADSVVGTSKGYGSRHLKAYNYVKGLGLSSKVPVTGVSLNKSSATISKDGTLQLSATVSPSNATNPNVTWSSSNTSVCTVSSTGYVKSAGTAGTATITVKTADGGYTATCKVTVEAVITLEKPVVSVVAKGYDSIKVSWDEVANAKGYDVYRSTSSTSSSFNKIITITGGSITDYLDVGLAEDTKYYYKVQAYADNGLESDISSYAYATTLKKQNVPTISSVSVTPEGTAYSGHKYKMVVKTSTNVDHLAIVYKSGSSWKQAYVLEPGDSNVSVSKGSSTWTWTITGQPFQYTGSSSSRTTYVMAYGDADETLCSSAVQSNSFTVKPQISLTLSGSEISTVSYEWDDYSVTSDSINVTLSPDAGYTMKLAVDTSDGVMLGLSDNLGAYVGLDGAIFNYKYGAGSINFTLTHPFAYTGTTELKGKLTLTIYGDTTRTLTINLIEPAVSGGYVNEAVAAKMDELYALIGGPGFFTVNGKSCTSSFVTGHACDNCFNEYVLNATWFKNTFGTISYTSFPTSYSSSGEYTQRGWSCLGFAHFAEYWLYRDPNNPSTKVSTKKIGTYTFNQANATAYAQTGDVIRFGSTHSAICYYSDANGMYVLDCNWGMNGKQCRVDKHYIGYDKYSTFTISRAYNA